MGPQRLTKDAAVMHCSEGIGIWQWASNDQAVRAGRGRGLLRGVLTLETLAPVSTLRERLPKLRIRAVKVVALMKLQPPSKHPAA